MLLPVPLCLVKNSAHTIRRDMRELVRQKQIQQVSQRNQHSQVWMFSVDQVVWARSWHGSQLWVMAKVRDRLGLVSYLVEALRPIPDAVLFLKRFMACEVRC